MSEYNDIRNVDRSIFGDNYGTQDNSTNITNNFNIRVNLENRAKGFKTRFVSRNMERRFRN